MERVITNEKVRFFYHTGDEIVDLATSKVHVVERVDTENKTIICEDGEVLALSKDIRPTLKTLKLAKFTDKRIQDRKQLIIKVKYFDESLEKLKQINIGNWIDLRSSIDVEIKKGEYKLLPLGVAMELPKGFEAYIVPRSSTYKNFKVIQTNHHGVVDESYKGDNDQWYCPIYALEDTKISKNDRICQFRIQRIMPKVEIVEVESLGNDDRQGIGSTGVK